MPLIGEPYWWATAPRPAVEPGPPAPRVDVAVIGGGCTGLAAARRLAAGGARVAVFEQEAIGAGASSRNGGQVLTGLTLDTATLLARYGRERAGALFQASLDAIDALERLIAQEAIDCGFVRCGHLEAAVKASHVDALARERDQLAREFGHEVRLVPRSDVSTELGSEAYHGLLVDERSARLHPAQYVYGLAGAARRAGAALHERTAVRRIDADGDRLRLETTQGVVSAAEVIVATNGYTGAATPALRRRLVAVGSYMLATEPLSRAEADRLLPRRRVVYESRVLLHYFQLAPDRRLLFGGRATFAPASPRSERASAAVLLRDLRGLFPQLRDLQPAYVWGGNVAIARDRMPHAGRLGRLHYAAGYGGHGLALSTTLGDVIGRRLLGEPAGHPLLEAPFRPFPLYRGRAWFLPAVSAWYRLLDRLS
ncbi:MAG TPA: FAD-binding oxidoreductase [Vicinamibacterales bacterium]|nr:FAD-binding oxidoreductase [Vicinamibacterales bacterium]